MKKLLLLFVSLFVVTAAMADIGPINRSTNLEFDGSIKNGTLEQVYIKAINRDGASMAAGTVACLDLTLDDGASVVSCPATAGGRPVCVMSVACADDAACNCQTYGYSSAVLFDSTNSAATAGQQAYISENNAGYIQAEALASVVATDHPVGVFYDSPSASASVELFIKLR